MTEAAVAETNEEAVEAPADESAETEYEHGYLRDKEPTHLHKHYVEWIEEKTGIKVDAKAAQLAVSLYQKYQKSPENAERREAERDEREAAQAEAREARQKAAAEKKAKAEAEAAEKAEKAKTEKAAKTEGSDAAPTKSTKKVVKGKAGAKPAAGVEAPF